MITKRVKRTFKNENAVTLIALVITIIVLLILAGVSIAMLTGDNGIITQAQNAKEKTEEAKIREEQQLESLLNKITSEVPSEEGFNESKNVNSPKVTQGMIPIKYNGTDWVVCSKEDPEWYNYDDTKKWANVMLSDGTYKEGKVPEGQIVKENELGSMYVWIPRYAYRIAGEKNIEVNFLKGNTNQDKDGKEYTEDENTNTKTTPIVHPAFKLGGGELSGIWVAKFEASGTNKDEQAVGNGSSTSSAQQYAPDETTIAKSLPNKISWRYITIGESEKRSMDIATTAKEQYGLEYANSHLIRNSEWGAVAYLCYSKYGNVPKINGAGSVGENNYYYDFYTGQGPEAENNEGRYDRTDNTHNYNTSNGVLASTTGNVTGIYDMNGGAWERVAGYLDNGNGNLSYYGKSADGKIKYFENGKINESYKSLWDSYEVSEEERTNKISLGDGTILTQGELWNGDKNEIKHQEARYRITKAIYDNMEKYKGIGVNEVSTEFSFYTPYGLGTETNKNPWGWFKTVEQAANGKQDLARTWDNDYVLIGHGAYPFVIRGGYCNDGSAAGVLNWNVIGGHAYNGFRSVLVM